MTKKNKAVIGIFAALALLLTAVFPVMAGGEKPEKVLHIASNKDFFSFAQKCRLDRYSEHLTVILDKDIDITGTSFEGIPIFSGTFRGNGHTIKGLNLEKEGSTQGLFRYLTESARVENLIVQGKVMPEGSCEYIGGLAGSNAGTVVKCRFEGQVSGGDMVGGLVGINEVSGTVDGCQTSGRIHGNHFVGGLVGKNSGLVRSCVNTAKVNDTAEQSSIPLEDVTLDTVTNTESAKTVTDIGGIAGTNKGVIRQCTNKEVVGYPHIGYNVGGIAGSQQGYMDQCQNSGTINGRKEVGGIVGQMEPVSKMQYSDDTLKILQKQLNEMASITQQASTNVHSSSDTFHKQMDSLKGQANTAMEAVSQLLPSKDNPHFFPDADQILTAKNTLSSTMSTMQSTVDSMTSSAQDAASSANSDMKAIANQMNAMNHTLNNASDHLGGSIADVSDKDKKDDKTGKIENCKNTGAVSGDTNTGGIVGAVSIENDLDPEDDVQISGDRSLKFNGELRAVILSCDNAAPVTVKKHNGGGIVGRLALGLTKSCVNSGTLNAESADYIGGIAGISTGYLRHNGVKCEITGRSYVGGIVGSASVVTDCCSITAILEATHQYGAVLGAIEDSRNKADNSIARNVYLPASNDLGAIDGISYAGKAESIDLKTFVALKDVPERFKTSTIIFAFEDGKTNQHTVPLGGKIPADKVPPVPAKKDFVGVWEGLGKDTLSQVFFDKTFTVSYTPYHMTVQSTALRDDGKPVLLAEGYFPDMQHIDSKPADTRPALGKKQTFIEGWTLPLFSDHAETKLRFSIPGEYTADNLKILVEDSSSEWKDIAFTVNGSYLVFSVAPGTKAFCVVSEPQPQWWVFYAAAGAVLLIIAIIVICIVHKKRRKKAAANRTKEAAIATV